MELHMRMFLIGALALTGVAMTQPASAQGVYFGVPGVSVGVGAPRERHYEYDRPRHRVYRERRERRYNRSYARSECRTITIRRDDGSVRRIRRCD